MLFLIIKAYNTYIAKPDDEAATDTELSLLTEIRDELRSGSADPLPGRQRIDGVVSEAQPPV